MHYVKHFNINNVETKQVACIELQGKPNAATEGAVGVLGIDVTSPTHGIYECIAVNGSIYTWKPVAPLEFVGGIVNLRYAVYETLFTLGDDKDQPYRNSFSQSHFSRDPQVGELFSFLFTEAKGRLVFGVAKITSEINDSGFYPFEMVFATRYNDLKTETWTFTVDNGDGTITDVPKEVYVK